MEGKLAQLLEHAAKHVPFYQDCYRQLGLRSNALGGVEDLRHLPVMTKSAYQEYGLERFLAQNLPTHQRLESATSGSTGDPFRFYLDREASPIVFASHLFYDSWFQLKPFDRHMRILPPTAEEPSFVGNASLPVRARQLARSKLQGLYERFTQKRINLWNINSVAAEQIHQEIEKFQPDYILGYSSSLSTIADLLLQKNLLLSRPMKGSITIAETLTVPRQRLIKEYFRGPIINRYGLREFKYWSAQNCAAAADKFHVNTELVVPEVVRLDGTPASPGELGRLVMTNLFNYVMPFIRYDTGDLAIVRWTQCSCGRGFPQIELLERRAQEYLQMPSGDLIYSSVLGHYLFVVHNYVDAIKHYQFVAESPYKVRFCIVAGKKFNDDVKSALKRDLERLLGYDVTLTIETVTEIPPEKSGKRPIIKRPASHA